MKQFHANLFILVALLFAGFQSVAQEAVCGFDKIYQKQLREDPLFKMGVENANQQWAAYSRSLRESGRKFSVMDDDEVYEIPVVVHILHPGTQLGTNFNPTDQTVIDWINYLNQVYAAEYPDYLPVNGGGVKMPVKFILAKWDPNCQATSGIDRVDMSANFKYVNYGVNYDYEDGLSTDEISKMFQWPKEQYYNIYIVNKIDGYDGYTSANYAGFAYYGYNNTLARTDGAYILDRYSRAGMSTLPHEIAHAFGLYHTFEGSSYSTCASNDNCEEDGDKVCDTDPGISLSGTCPDPADINPCTGSPYGVNGVQHNIMNYTNCVRNHFTPGQAERMMFMFRSFRAGLISSRALAESAPVANHVPSPAVCIPDGITNPGSYRIGPANVLLDSIQHYSVGFSTLQDSFYYVDNTTKCILNSHTTLKAGLPYELSVSTVANKQKVKAYIDYNNDGAFNDNEIVMDVSTPDNEDATFTVTVTPPDTAIMEIPLRMRVVADFNTEGINPSPCGTLTYGQAEDFSVTIIPGGDVVFTGLTSFTGKISGNNSALLQWHIENTPLQVSRFELERSMDGQSFYLVRVINRESGINDYRYEDVLTDPSHRYYYRLRVLNGNRPEYSKVISLSLDNRSSSRISVFPNPVSDVMTIQSDNPVKAVNIFDVYGRRIISRFDAGVSDREIKLNLNKYPSGIYLIQVIDVNEATFWKKVVKE